MHIIKWLLLLASYFFVFRSIGQNLVPNPGFEQNYSAPYCLDEFDKVKQWYNACHRTPDYIYTDAPTDGCSLGYANALYNHWGHQLPHGGSYYAALHTFCPISGDSREYIACNLSVPMIVGLEYEVEMFLSSCDYSSIQTNISVLFLYDSVDEYYCAGENVNPQLISQEVFSDKVNWQKFNYKFIADKPYKAIDIGSLLNYTDNRFEIVNLGYSDSTRANFGTYYIDDVSIKLSPIYAPHLGNDTIICRNQPIVLDANVKSDSYYWNTGDSTRSISVNSPGTYIVYAIHKNQYLSDTIFVNAYSDYPQPNLGQDVGLCTSDSISILLNAEDANDFNNYIWSINDTVSRIVATTYGEYSVIVTDLNNCKGYDTLRIYRNCPDCIQALSLFPNPASTGINLKFSVDNNYPMMNVEMYEAMGKVVFSHIYDVHMGINEIKFSTEMLQSGSYYLKAILPCGKVVLPFKVVTD